MITRVLFPVIFLAFLVLSSCSSRKDSSKDLQIAQLNQELEHLRLTNTHLLARLEDLSVINKSGAESISKSLESLDRQYHYIEDLTRRAQQKDSINLVLVSNIKRSLVDKHDSDIQVEVRGGVVYVSISDQLLFRSGSFQLNDRANQVLGKLSTILNDHENLEVLVEGHTDDVPIQTGCIEDNWDLSVKRATSVVRSLQSDHFVSPERLTAGGRSYYMPKSDNETQTGRQSNRRTEIIIKPRLDQYFELASNLDLAG